MRAEGDPERAATAGRLLSALACLAAGLFVLAALQHGRVAANDFEWSGARLLVQGRDPYRALLDGHGSAFAMTQFPNYAPLLYVLLLPLGALSLAEAEPVWAVLNLGMLLAAVVMVTDGVGLRGWRRVALVASTFVSEPFVITLGVGQTAALALFTAVLAVRSTGGLGAGTALGTMLVKYSFAPVALVAVARRRWVVLTVAVAAQAAGVVVFCVLTGSFVLSAVVSPLRVAERTQPIASGDFLTLTRLVAHDELLGFTVAIGACVALSWCARRVLSGPHWVDALSAGALVSLLVFPHLVYDYCFLLPVVGSALRREWRPRLALVTPVAFLWYDWLLPDRLMTPYRLPAVIVTLLMLLFALVVLVRTAALPAHDEQGQPSATGTGPRAV